MEEELVYEKPKEVKKSHKKLIGVLVLLVVIVIISYFVLFQSIITPAIKDCGTYTIGGELGSVEGGDEKSLTCFENATLDCTPAKIVFVNAFGPGLSILSEIKSANSSHCFVYNEIIDGSQNMIGLNENCNIPREIMASGSVSYQQRFDCCSGSLTEWLKQAH